MRRLWFPSTLLPRTPAYVPWSSRFRHPALQTKAFAWQLSNFKSHHCGQGASRSLPSLHVISLNSTYCGMQAASGAAIRRYCLRAVPCTSLLNQPFTRVHALSSHTSSSCCCLLSPPLLTLPDFRFLCILILLATLLFSTSASIANSRLFSSPRKPCGSVEQQGRGACCPMTLSTPRRCRAAAMSRFDG